ncbi:LysR family transcriptional regulator [Pseudomonas fluorescens]|uniref:LysR family transcriptional regulator n=1 Tax=Pseudomonas fluorescens TaxID=294 RepID=UPI001A9E168A|nr:LysR family transcriptional regulator [Pseudomonas fluorescens]QTD31614.1 LysR family transcriptional regulator [Pseudomonas fluorescens]
MYSSERLKGVHTFICVADMGSFAAAAERLNVTASAVSKGIARLEDRLQTRLFERTTRSLSLTNAGTSFYQTCTRVMSELEEAEQSFHRDSSEPAGIIRVDLPAWYGRMHAFPIILKLVQTHPKIVPNVSFTDRIVDLVEDNIDIVVRIGGSDIWPDDLDHQFLGMERMIFCASAAYLQEHGAPLDETDLQNHRFVLYGLPKGKGSPLFTGVQAGERKRRVVAGNMIVGDGESQVMAVLAGHGIAQLSTWMLQEHLQTGALVEVLPHLATEGLPVNLVWRKKRHKLRRVRILLEMLAAHLTPDGRVLV